MKISDHTEARAHLVARLEATTAAGELPALIAELPGVTFYDPTGWRFALVWQSPRRLAVTRVGPRGGIEHLYGLTAGQLDYLGALL